MGELNNQVMDKREIAESDEMVNGYMLTDMEIDALGESMNISMGAAAKALSTMLNMKVLITTPEVSIIHSDQFKYKSMLPAVGVKIGYIEGLTGINFLVLKKSDIKKIVDIMMGVDEKDSDDEFGELHISASCEIMNQMMGSSSTSLATFYNRKINISTPECILIEQNVDAKDSLELSGVIAVVKLQLIIGDIIDSEVINVMPIHFAKELVDNLINIQLPTIINAPIEYSSEELKNNQSRQMQQNRDQVQGQPVHQSAEMMQRQPVYQEPARTYENTSFNQGAVDIPRSGQENRDLHTGYRAPNQENRFSPVNFNNLNYNDNTNAPILANLNVIMDVPLEITVEIGRTKKQVREIIELTQGSVIELDKLAEDPVDIIVNGELIARGDVVVIDDNFGVRITEIVNTKVK